MSLDDVAKVTKIQPRILERLEAGRLDGLPAEVFVRGFVRSFARCVGLDEAEALQRHAACGLSAGSVDLTPTVRGLIESMADLAPGSATAARATPRKMHAVEVIDFGGPVTAATEAAGEAVAEAPPATLPPILETSAGPVAVEASMNPLRRKRHRRRRARAAVVETRELGAESAPAESPASPSTAETAPGCCASPEPGAPDGPEGPPASSASPDPTAARGAEPAVAAAEPSGLWAPKMPPISATPSVPWRRPGSLTPVVPTVPPALAAPAALVPSLVIDDADPESAERALEERAETLAPRRSFLPPILLDREDRSARQGGLTLAVILLLIAATLTLSYLMRRPSASGDGMTLRDTPVGRLGALGAPGAGPAPLG
jgi:hypothetical protein